MNIYISRFLLTFSLIVSFFGTCMGMQSLNEDRIRKNPSLIKILLTSAGIDNNEALALTREKINELVQIVEAHNQDDLIHNAICITCNQPEVSQFEIDQPQTTSQTPAFGTILGIQHLLHDNKPDNRLRQVQPASNKSPNNKKLIDDEEYDQLHVQPEASDISLALRESIINKNIINIDEKFLQAVRNNDFETVLNIANEVSEDAAQQALEIAFNNGNEVIVDVILNRQSESIHQSKHSSASQVSANSVPQNDQNSEAIFLKLLASEDTQPNMALEIIKNNKNSIFSERDKEHNNLFHILLHKAFDNPAFIEVMGKAIRLDQNNQAINDANGQKQTPLSLAQDYLMQYEYYGEIVGMLDVTIGHQPMEEDDVRAPMHFEPGQLIEPNNQQYEEDYFFATERNLATILQHANSNRAISYARDLIADGAVDLYEADNKGYTPLMIAAKLGYKEIVHSLISQFADPCEINQLTNENTLLVVLENPAYKDHLSLQQQEIIEMLLSREDVSQMLDLSSNFGNALTLATQLNNITFVQKIIDLKPELLEIPNGAGQTALHIALVNNFKDISQLLFDHHASFDVKDIHGNSPLQSAIKLGHLDIITTLMDQGLNLDEESYQLALRKAIEKRDLKLVEGFILSRDPQSSQQTRDLILQNTHLGNSESEQIIQQLLLLSDDLYNNIHFVTKLARKAYVSDTPVIEYARTNKSQKIKEIMGADVNAKNAWGLTPLIVATLLCHDKCVLQLLSKQADPNTLVGGKTVSEFLNLLLENDLLGENGYVFYDLLERIEKLQDMNKIQEEKDKRSKLREAALRRFESNSNQ